MGSESGETKGLHDTPRKGAPAVGTFIGGVFQTARDHQTVLGRMTVDTYYMGASRALKLAHQAALKGDMGESFHHLSEHQALWSGYVRSQAELDAALQRIRERQNR